MSRLIRARRPGATQLLARIVETPELVAAVGSLEPRALTKLPSPIVPFRIRQPRENPGPESIRAGCSHEGQPKVSAARSAMLSPILREEVAAGDGAFST